MTDIDTRELTGWIGKTMVGSDGEKIGTIGDIYMDEETGKPEWLAVKTGLFGSRLSSVPLEGASQRGDDVMVRFTKDQVKDAPHVEADGALSQDEEARLYEHYGLSYSEARSDTGVPGGTRPSVEGEGRVSGELADTGRDTSGPSTDEAMTRSEEELKVSKTAREAGRVRLRKWIETEHVSKTVPVTHEEARIEREPITEGNVGQAMAGPELSEEEHEMVLHREEATAETEVVPKERVRLEKEEVTEEQQVGADIRKERIELERDEEAERRR